MKKEDKRMIREVIKVKGIRETRNKGKKKGINWSSPDTYAEASVSRRKRLV